MSRCVNCIYYEEEKQKCNIDNRILTINEICMENNLCDNYIPTLEYIKAENRIKDEEYF